MADVHKLSPSILRRAENTELSLGSLEAIAAIRARLDLLERGAMLSAREKGATLEDIAEALRLTPQAIYYRFRNMRDDSGDQAIVPTVRVGVVAEEARSTEASVSASRPTAAKPPRESHEPPDA